MKCDICDEKVQTVFLGKILGTIIRKEGKRKAVCSSCQKTFKDRASLLAKL